MPTATLPMVWTGRSKREYVPVEGTRLRHGGMATVRKVSGRGGRVGTSTVEDGVPLALKLWHEGDETSLDQLQHEARILVEISSQGGELPCPRLYDLIGSPLVTGVVMEWCPVDLERWWRERLKAADAFGRLFAALADASRRVADYHELFAAKKKLQAAHGDLKPSNILLSSGGRWLISDFGTATVPLPEDDAWAESRVIVATENFLAPEVMFNARKEHPVAMDTWSLGATAFALLRLRQMVVDGSNIPRNGTHSPRFRMDRMNQVIEVFARDPTRFADRDLDPNDFPDPLRLPEADRRAVRDLVVGVFGAPQDPREETLSDELLMLLDRCMSIDPVHRYTNCRDLAAAFDNLTRTYIRLSATALDLPEPPLPDLKELLRSRDEAVRRTRSMQDDLLAAQARVAALEAELQANNARPAEPVETPGWHPPAWLLVVLVIFVVAQVMMMVGLLGLVALAFT